MPRNRSRGLPAWHVLLAIPILLPSIAMSASALPPQDANRLMFDPARPAPGAQVEVSYVPWPALRGQPRLHLRARERTPDDEPYETGLGSRTVAVLEPAPDGSYRGRFRLPDGVVYAAFAVEDAAGSVVDSREGSFWELLVHDGGAPLFQALVQRFDDHMGRDQLAVLETAREATRLYPDTIQAWTLLRAAEGWVLGEEGSDERAEAHRRRAAGFDSLLRGRTDLTADQVGYMYWYAADDLRDAWRSRLLREHPGHFFAIQERVMEERREMREDPEALLEALDSVWAVASDDRARARIFGPAFQAALGVGDPGRARTWAERASALSPSSRLRLLLALASVEPGVIPEIRMRIGALGAAPDADRPLGATRSEHRQASARRAAALRTELGAVLLEAGRAPDAVAVLRRAASVGWDTRRYRLLGEALAAAGDTAGAVEAFAAVAADPATAEREADSLRARVGVAAAPWRAVVAGVRGEMRRRTLASGERKALGPIELTDAAGNRVGLGTLLGEEATVVAIWSRYCGYSVQAMPAVVALGERLASEGIPLLAITADAPAEATAYLEESGLAPNVWFDAEGDAARILNSWGTPQYFVLDGQGRLRFAFSSLEDLPREVWALRASR